MPDLTIEHHFHCDTADYFVAMVPGSNGRTHTVTLSRHNKGECQINWACTCEAFRFGKGKPCKHIKAAQKTHCGWMGFVDGGKVDHKNGKPVCPKCGGPVSSMGWAV
jgi:hypothetical protein